jgi:hypothetical protein
MSRHRIPHPNPAYEIIVGWDNPLGSFFCQVVDESVPMDEDHVLYWRGTTPGAIPTVDALAEIMSDYVTLTYAEKVRLAQDQQQRTEPTPFQQTMLAMMERT